ncbi:XRE family transcriptional regulator [Pseudomonas putida]
MLSTTAGCTLPRMKTTGSRIAASREKIGMNQSELGRALKVSPQSVQAWESDKNVPRPQRLRAIADTLGVTVAYLMGETGSDNDGWDNVNPGPPITSEPRRIEIVGTAQLGNDGYWLALDAAEGWVETWSRDEDAYALRLKGDSMAPAIRSGWIAVCEPNHRLVPGEYVMVTTVDGQSMVKELLFENEEGVNLASVNAAYGERRVIAWTEIDKIHYVGNILAPSKVLSRI